MLTSIISSAISIILNTHTNEKSLNRPLKVLEKDRLGTTLRIVRLTTVNANKSETNTLDENVVNLRINKDVVNVKLDTLKIGRRGDETTIGDVGTSPDLSVSPSGWVSTRNLTSELSSCSQLKGDETLTVRDGDRRDRKTRILVAPEEKRDEKLDIVSLDTRRRLKTIATYHLGTVRNVSGRNIATLPIRLIEETRLDILLSDTSVPSKLLVRLDRKLTMVIDSIASVLIKRVAINLELNILKETLTRVSTPTNKILPAGGNLGVIGITGREDGLLNDGMNNHIIEEITELGDAEGNLASE
jgi:hypothetical protein